MKRTILTLTMVLASSVCSQSFGFDLLDKMLGMKGCGSAASCCDTGCDTSCYEPACGCEDPCGCAAEPACGCEDPCGCAMEPACGCEMAGCDSGCDSGCFGNGHGGLLSKLFGKHGCDSGCDACGCAEPACGCEDPCGCAAGPACGCEVAACDSGCGCGGKKHGGLLSKLFGNLGCHDDGCDSACDMGCDMGCGCAAPMVAPAPAGAPMPPAPVVDPSASVSSKRRVIQASAVFVR